MMHDQLINLEALTVKEFCEITAERGLKPTVILAEFLLRRDSITPEG